MSVEINMVTQAKDLPELLEWIAKVLRTYPQQRWSLQISLKVQNKDP